MAHAAYRDAETARDFAHVFRVTEDHRLVLIRRKSRAGVINADYWSHNEYDAHDRLVGRYESFDEWNPKTGTHRSGWRKYDADGSLLESSDTLGHQG